MPNTLKENVQSQAIRGAYGHVVYDDGGKLVEKSGKTLENQDKKCGNIRVKRLFPEAILPERATQGSAGLDLHVLLADPFELKPGEQVKLRTGIAIELPPGTVGLVFGRSGLGIRYGITLSNSVGVIDSDFRGELMVGLCNHGAESYTLSPGERIAQLLVMPAYMPEVIEVENLSGSERGEGGFGSTGRC